ncbi:MAG: DNA ligase D [Candidatus Dormibacteria bacterium]
MPLEEYRRKRDFTATPEPSGDPPPSGPTAVAPAVPSAWGELPPGRRFCVQMHRATRFHFDFRLEHEGVLMSWAVPRGPSLDPALKRLAVHVEDHPLDYGDFEGVIPSGYGAGTVMLWDIGNYSWARESIEDSQGQITSGDIKFELHGTKLRGEFALVHVGGRRPGDDPNAWLLLKKRDEFVVPGFDAKQLDHSVKTGRRLAEIAADGGGDPRDGTRPAGSTRRRSSHEPAGAASGAVPVAPMKATAVDRPFSRQGWLFEIKYDGVRAIVSVEDGSVTLTGRSGRDETARYPEARLIPSRLGARSAVLDAEIVVLDEEGKPSFERLQARINLTRAADIARAAAETPVSFVLFDLLELDGRELTDTALRIRKKTLRDVLVPGPQVLFADHVEADGEAFFEALRQRGLEGMVAKRGDSAYQPGRRSPDWLKVKAWQSQSCVICGHTAGRGTREAIGALILGVVGGDGGLVHCGQVGTGFDERALRELAQRLGAAGPDRCPFPEPPRTSEPATWVRPEMVCEVRHAGWTRSGVLRHPSYQGLRSDIAPGDCRRETAAPPSALLGPGPAERPETRGAGATTMRLGPGQPAPERSPELSSANDSEVATDGGGAALRDALRRLTGLRATDNWEIAGRTVHLTNLDKVLWPGEGITKRDMVRHYVTMAPYLLPYLRDRPLSMQVFPDGITGKSFWRKDKPHHAPEWISSWTYHGEKVKVYILVNEVATLAWLANAGVIDLHPWHSRHDQPELPDWAVFDLDPFEPATFADVVHIARLVKAALDHYGMRAVAKTSGQTGLQIYVPLRRGPDYTAVRNWVEDVGRAIGRVEPQLITWEWSVAKRDGRIRIDYTQNIINKTLAAPYSLRPAPGAPVSTPIRWEELDDPELRPDQWTIATIGDRLASVGDLFAPALAGDQPLPVSS